MEAEDQRGEDSMPALLGEFAGRMLVSLAVASASILLAGGSVVSVRVAGLLFGFLAEDLGLPGIPMDIVDAAGEIAFNLVLSVGGLTSSLIAYVGSRELERALHQLPGGRAEDLGLPVLLLKIGSLAAIAGSVLLLLGAGLTLATAGFIVFQAGLAIMAYWARSRGGLDTSMTLLLAGASLALIGAAVGVSAAVLAGMAIEAVSFYRLRSPPSGRPGREGETL
ncbi:hypothetical protein [Aeropyrum pernix]|uniref:hypothetical protein n=1 Tax=Aeropyrum pernix TaxID=56636 RepID=UPI00103812EE|nr:hypothetical protein [Aeropyrum pernix]